MDSRFTIHDSRMKTPAPSDGAGVSMCSRLESNQHHSLRRGISYPLNDESVMYIFQNHKNHFLSLIIAIIAEN